MFVFGVNVDDDAGCGGTDGAEEVECIGYGAVVVDGYGVGYAGAWIVFFALTVGLVCCLDG